VSLDEAIGVLVAIHTRDDPLGFCIVPDAKPASFEAPHYAQAWRVVRAHLRMKTETRCVTNTGGVRWQSRRT
jgi:hypothetical protein